MPWASPITLCVLYATLALLLRLRFRNRLVTGFFILVWLVCGVVLWNHYHREIRNTWQLVLAFVTSRGEETSTWPPKLGMPFPDLLLYDAQGNLVRLSSFRGRPILVELVATGSPASVALAGGHAYGPFDGVPPQQNLESLAAYLEKFGPVKSGDPRWLHVQIVLYGPDLQAPSIGHVARWANHFQLHLERGHLVLAGDRRMLPFTQPTMVPGFYLVDDQFIVRMESWGMAPQHDLYRDVIPVLHDLLEPPSPVGRSP